MPASAPRRRGRGKRLVSDINVVPYIDVMLVLLVIFMVTAPFVPTSTIDLPAVDATPRQPEPYIEVQVAADGKLTLQTRNQPKPQEIQVTRERLPEELKQLLTTLAADGKATSRYATKPSSTSWATSSSRASPASVSWSSPGPPPRLVPPDLRPRLRAWPTRTPIPPLKAATPAVCCPSCLPC